MHAGREQIGLSNQITGTFFLSFHSIRRRPATPTQTLWPARHWFLRSSSPIHMTAATAVCNNKRKMVRRKSQSQSQARYMSVPWLGAVSRSHAVVPANIKAFLARAMKHLSKDVAWCRRFYALIRPNGTRLRQNWTIETCVCTACNRGSRVDRFKSVGSILFVGLSRTHGTPNNKV